MLRNIVKSKPMNNHLAFFKSRGVSGTRVQSISKTMGCAYLQNTSCCTRNYHTTKPLLQSSHNNNNNTTSKSTPIGQIKVDKHMLMIAFTCKVCGTRSGHQMSKQAYTKGSVLIQCPGCKNRHLIADHLNIFQDKKKHVDIEELMKLQNESVSTDVQDLCFEDIPEALKNKIGHFAKDAPEDIRKNLTNTTNVHNLPPPPFSSNNDNNNNNKN